MSLPENRKTAVCIMRRLRFCYVQSVWKLLVLVLAGQRDACKEAGNHAERNGPGQIVQQSRKIGKGAHGTAYEYSSNKKVRHFLGHARLLGWAW